MDYKQLKDVVRPEQFASQKLNWWSASSLRFFYTIYCAFSRLVNCCQSMQPLIVYGPEIAFSPSIIRAIGLFRTIGLYIYCFKGALSLCLLFVKVFRYESCCELSSWLSVTCWLFLLVLPMLTILLTRCRPCMGLLLWPQKLAILGIVASGVQIGRSVTSEAPIRINVVLRLVVFIVVVVVCADGHCEPFCCLARVIYPEWCRNNLDSWCPLRGCAIHGFYCVRPYMEHS